MDSYQYKDSTKGQESSQKLPYLNFLDPKVFIIVETDASNEGYGGILKHRIWDQEKKC